MWRMSVKFSTCACTGKYQAFLLTHLGALTSKGSHQKTWAWTFCLINLIDLENAVTLFIQYRFLEVKLNCGISFVNTIGTDNKESWIRMILQIWRNKNSIGMIFCKEKINRSAVCESCTYGARTKKACPAIWCTAVLSQADVDYQTRSFLNKAIICRYYQISACSN